MRPVFVATYIVIAAATQCSTTAFGLTSDELYGACVVLGKPGMEAQGIFCTAYVNGVIDGLNLEHHESPRWCIPKGTSAGQVAQLVLKWLAAQAPENRKNYPAAGDVMWAVERAWPCAPVTGRPPDLIPKSPN